MKNTESKTLPSDTRAFLGIDNGESGGAKYDATVREPSFGKPSDEDLSSLIPTTLRYSPLREVVSPLLPEPSDIKLLPDMNKFDERTAKERRARARASAQMLFGTDVSKLDDAGAAALYQSVTEGMFGIPDMDGSVAFGKRASKDPRQNIDLLRRFVKGEYSLIEDPEYTKWKNMGEEEKFRYALEHETIGNMIKSKLKGERGTSPQVALAAGDVMSSGYAMPWTEEQRKGLAVDRKWREDAIRNAFWDTMDEEERIHYRKDVFSDYEKKLSRRQTLATFLQYSQGLSDRASYVLAKSFADGNVNASEVESLEPEDRDLVYSAFSLMRGDQKKGRILGIQTDFTDDTVMNRFQLGLYGFQQSVVGLVTDTADMGRNAAMWTYAKCALDEQERKDFFNWWDGQARAEQAMKQQLPDADGFGGEMFQGVMENLHWFIPYTAIGKGGKMVNAARGVKGGQGFMKGVATTLRPMRLGGKLKEEKATLEAGKAAMEAGAAATKAAWTLDVNGVKKLGEMGSAILARQMAAVDRYSQMLAKVNKELEAAKWWKDAAGTGMWMAGEASAFSAFASEYIANADAAGISREESVLTAAAIGFINAKIEQLYVPGLESSLTSAQIKSLMFTSMAQAIKTDGAAGFRRWLANRVRYGVTEGLKVAATEGLVEEPLQQMAVEHGKAFDKMCQELRANGQATLANEAAAFWESFAKTLPNDYATFIDTAVDMVPSSVGFGVTTIGNMTRRQHIHNAMTRHANRRAGATATDTMFNIDLQGGDISKAYDYDAGVVDMIQRAVDVRNAMERHWNEAGEADNNPHRFEEAITAARRAWRNPQTGDAVQEIADAAGVDVKTAEVLAQYLQIEAEATAFSPQARAWTSLNMSLADIDEATIKTVLPGYVEGSFASDPENGIYSGRVRMDDGTEKTIAYRVGDLSAELVAEAQNMAKADSSFGKSFDARHAEIGDGVTWASLSDAQRYAEAVRSQASVNGFSTGKSGVFELTDSKGEKVRVNADDIIYLANGRIGDIGYGPAATQGTVRHETFHSLWRFIRGTLADADVQQLAKTLGIDVTKDGWEVELDEKMAHEMERYASGHYVSHAVSSRFDKMLDSWAGKIINFFGKFGPSDEVTDPKTGKPYQLKGLYDSILRGELGSGALGVELRKVPAQPVAPTSSAPKSTMPVEVTDADRAEAEAEAQAEVDESAKADEKVVQPKQPETEGAGAKVDESGLTETKVVHSAENPADASTPNQRFYKVGLPNSPVKLVGRLKVRDVDTGIITSTDADYHDRGNQNRDDKSEESRALVEKIGANPDPLQVGTVQPIASNGIVWALPNGDVIIGNHRVNGVRLGYAKGTAGDLEKFVREDAAKRGIAIGDDVKKPLLVFVLERIESPDGKADVHEVVRLANESQNRGFNVREQASNDAKILIDNNLLPQMVFRADGRIDETKSGDAIGKFRQESGAQGLIAEDGSLTEEGQTRIQNAALAVLLGGEGNNALLNKIMTNAGRLDMQGELRALMKMTPELMALAEAKPAYDLRAPLAEALQLFTEWRDKDETARVEKGKTRHDWRETKDGRRVRGLSWEAFMSQGDMFRQPSDEAKILGDLFAKAEQLRSFDREDVESAAGKKRVIDLISDYLTDYIANARAVNTDTEDMFGGTPASRAEVMSAQRAKGGENGAVRFSTSTEGLNDQEKSNLRIAQTEAQRVLDRIGGTEIGHYINEDFRREGRSTLIGKRVASARDLAALAQIYRNPCFETFRYFFTKNGEVVWQTGITARMPGATNTSVNTPKENTYAEIERMAAKLKPDGVWLLHNHPSGHVAPSQQDINVTGELREYFDRLGIRLGGHVIIDHDTYADLDKWGNYTPRRISADKLDASYHGAPYTNRLRERGEPFNLGTVAAFAMNLQRDVSKPGKVLTLISVDSKAEFVTAVANIPAESVADGDNIGSRFKQLDGFFADWRSASGAGHLVVVGDQDVEKYPASVQRVLRRQIQIGNATDFIFSDSGTWDSVMHRGGVISRPAETNRLILSRTETFDDGQQRYSLAPNPNLRADITAALKKNSGGDDTTVQMKRHDEIVFSDNLPFFEFLGLPNVKVVTDVVKVRKFNIKHHLSEDQIAELPYRYNAPVAVMRDGEDGYVLLTDLMARDDHDNDKPVMVYLRRKVRPSGEVIFIATAFAKNAEDEAEYYGPLMKSGLLFTDENKIAGLALGEETESILRTQASGDHVLTSSDFSWWSTRHSVSQNGSPAQGDDAKFSVAQTATPQFKSWFGDWEKDPANASKIVDENGEPLVVWHGSTWNPIAEPNGAAVFRTGEGETGSGAHFGTRKAAEERGADRKHWNLTPVFLNIRNPLRVADTGYWTPGDIVAEVRKTEEDFPWLDNWDEIKAELKRRGYDGMVYENAVEDEGSDSYIAFEPTQVKSATDNSGAFDGTNPDTRYSIAGQRGAANMGLKGAAEAEAMEKAGADREEIWRKTGWWRGKDGQWRVELPDVKPSQGITVNVGTRRFKGPDGTYFTFRLGELVDGGEVGRAYPGLLDDVTIHFSHEMPSYQATYSPESKTIELSSRHMKKASPYADETKVTLAPEGMSMISHELQHAIQQREGFATGADANKLDWLEYRNTAGETESRNVQKRLAMTPEERAATPPWATEDVPADRQIVRFSVTAPLGAAMQERERRAFEPRAPQGESPYFAEAEGAMEFPIRALRTVKDEPERSIESARRHMEDAAAGRMPKLAPVSLVDNGDGTYTVIDGNAATWAAARGGLETVRAKVVGKDRGTRLANSHYLVNEDKSGCDADGKLHTHGLEGLTGENAREKAYEQANENAPLLKAVVDAAAKAVGGEALHRKSVKKRQRVDEKTTIDYNGDYSRVVDLIGGTLILDSSHDMADALKAIRKSLPQGASVAQVKKMSSPDVGGYWDVKLSVRFANGGIGEIIIVDRNINDAKFKRGGHDLYDYQRAIEEAKDTDELTAELYFALKQIELAIYSHNTPSATQHQATWAAAKASASDSLTRFLESHGRDFISSIDMGELKDLLEGSHLHQPASLDSYATPARSFIQNDISNSSLVGEENADILPKFSLTVNGENGINTKFSTEAPKSNLIYPQLRGMSDDELLSAAVAARIALGKSDKVSDRSVKVKTVQNLMRRLHPDWDTTKIGVESQRIMSGAQKFAKRIRDDIDRGVSDSLVLRHLPDTMREQFGREMRQEAREGARLGAFGVRANTAIEERQAKIVEDAVRVQTGLDSGAIENAYGINLSETIMHLAENPLTEKDTAAGTAGEGEGSADEEGDASGEESEEAAVEIDAKVKAVVDDIVSASGQQAGVDEQNRKNRKAAAGRDAENEKAMSESEDGEEDSVPADSSAGEEGDALAAAVAKEALNLENPRHLARFVAELARRQWINEHHLAKDADVWRDLVAVQFLRKTAQSVYAKLVRDLTYSRSRETAMGRIAKLDNVPTVAGLLSEMEFIGALVNANRIRETQKELCTNLEKLLKKEFGARGRFAPDKEEGKRKVSAEAELRARYMRKCMWFTPEKAEDEARELQETLDALSVDFQDAGRDRDQSREFVETIRKLNVLREFGALRYKPVGEIEAAVQWWQDFARGESDDIVREMSDRDIRTKKAAHLLAVAFADPKRTTIRESGKADALNRFITGHMGFISLLQDCMRHASDADAAAVKDIIDYISREIQKSGDRAEAEKRRHNDAFHAAVEGIYGRSFNAVMKDMMAPDERFTKFMGVVGGKRVTPTKGRALQLLVSLLQEGRKVQVEDEEHPGQMKTVWEGGYHDNIVKHHREGQAAEIMRLLDPADMNMLKWLGQWYENNRSDLSGVCHSLFGIGVYAELPNYFPVKMQLETQGLEKGNGVGWTIFPKALTPRVRNERDFDTSADIFSMWASRMEEAAQWKHHAQLGLEMRGIFGRSELREAVRANHGASVDDLMQGFITDILAGHGAYDRSTAGVQYFSDQIRGWTALCALGGNLGVMAKQTTSIPAFGFEIGLVNTAKYIVSAFTPEGMAAMGKIWDSEQRRTRWNLGSSEAVRNALSQQNAGLLKRLLQKSMITTKLGDVVPALVVGQGIYRDCLARGMSEDDAMAETWSIIERTQQSGRMENQTSIQRRNKLGRIMFQFLSTQQQYLQYEMRAIREVIARPDSVNRWGNLGRAILLNHFILSSAYYWMGQLYKYALGQEPPEDELKDWLITCLLGPYGSLFVAGFCCKYTLERAIKGYSIKGGSSMLPMESWLKNQVNDGAKLLEAIFDSDGDTWDNMLDAAGRWMSDSNSVVRDLRKIYRYRIKDEEQQ